MTLKEKWERFVWRHDDLFDLLKILIIVILVFVLIFGPLFAFVAWMNQASCVGTAHQLGLEYTWQFFGTCVVKTPSGVWMPLDKYQYVIVPGNK